VEDSVSRTFRGGRCADRDRTRRGHANVAARQDGGM